MRKCKIKKLPEWNKKAVHEDIILAELVERRRRQMLVHCCLYYEMDESLITDEQWQLWANELAQIQSIHGYQFGFYDEDFKDWDGSTGYHLPTRDDDVVRKASRLLIIREIQFKKLNS